MANSAYKYSLSSTTKFRRGLKRAGKQGKNISELEAVIDMLRRGKKLPPKYRDHKLRGNRKDYRECHIQPDWLLVYRIQDDKLILTLTEIGSHAELFDM